MRIIRFLSVKNVEQVHRDSMEQDGGLSGLRDGGLLESAVMMPQAQFGGQYLHDGVRAMAAAYLFHITQAHAFHDGNKRAAVLATLVFLDNNGYRILAHDEDIIAISLGIASGQISKEQTTQWVSKHSRLRRK